LTQNKLDISIFEFKDRPLFKRKDPSLTNENTGKIEISHTKPNKYPLALIEES
jgi:hypothetical protein